MQTYSVVGRLPAPLSPPSGRCLPAPAKPSPFAPSEHNLRVLDLASPGTASLGYHLRWPHGEVELNAISRELWPLLPLEGVRVHHSCGQLPLWLRFEKAGHYDHVHLHMMDGQLMDVRSTQSLFEGVQATLKAGGLFFFSFDDYFFQAAGAHFSPGSDGNLRCLLSLLEQSGLRPLFSHFDPRTFQPGLSYSFLGESGTLPPTVDTPHADLISNAFGFGPMREDALKLLSHFSSYPTFNIAHGCYPSFLVLDKPGGPSNADLNPARPI